MTTTDTPFGTDTALNGSNDHRQLVGAYDPGGLPGGFEASLLEGDDQGGSGFVAINFSSTRGIE